MGEYVYSWPINRSEDYFNTLPTIDGISADEVQRFEPISAWQCSHCRAGRPAKDRFFICQECRGTTSYILCQSCYEAGVRCYTAHAFKQARMRLEHDTESFYKNSPIPKRHIRVLHFLEAASFDAPLDCGISIEPVDEPLEYEALSYCWGSSVRTKLLKIGCSLVPITANLELALRRSRALGKANAVWVDAVCINQADNIEKNAQVSMMRDIYKNARCVYIYLGERDPALRLDLVIKGLTAKQQGTAEEDALSAQAMQALLLQDWFSRVWIVQEVSACAKAEVIYGDLTLDFRLLQERLSIDTSRLPDMNLDPTITNLGHIRVMKLVAKNFRATHSANMRHYYHKHHSQNEDLEVVRKALEFERTVQPRPYPLLELLQDFRDMEATNPRDKIYALLGLATDISFQHDGELPEFTGAVATVPRPDYNQPVQEVYYQYACYFIDNGSWSEVLHTASLNQSTSPLSGLLPSWVPDWTSYTKGVCPVLLDRPFGQYLHQAGGRWESSSSVYVDPISRALSLEGGIVDQITHVSSLPSSTTSQHIPPNISRGIAALVHDRLFCRKAALEGFQPLTVRDAITNNVVHLVMDCEECRQGAPYWLEFLATAFRYKYARLTPELAKESRMEYFEFSSQCWRAFKAGTEKDLEDPIESAFRNAFEGLGEQTAEAAWLSNREYVWQLLTGRRLCFTEGGRIGIVPTETEVNDVVCIFKGGITPFIIREEDEDWHFVGDAYLRGLMRGEALEEEGLVEMRLNLK